MRKEFGRILLFVLLAVGAPVAARAQLSVAVGGQGITAYLPLTLADRLGYFTAAGVSVSIHDVVNGTRMAEALVGGSAEIGFGSYEHVLHLRPKGLDLICIMLLNHTYGAVLALTKERARLYRGPQDLKGLSIGVIAPGSSMDVALQILLAKGGLRGADVSSIAVGTGAAAIAAMKSGRLDGIVHTDPVIARLVQDGDVVPVVDTRTEDGINYLYGGAFAGSAVLSTEALVKAKPEAVQAFITAVVRATRFLKHAPIDQVMAQVPPNFYGQDKEMYQAKLEYDRRTAGVYTKDGTITRDAARATLYALGNYDPVLKGKEGEFDLAASYDNRFVRKANGTLRGDD